MSDLLVVVGTRPNFVKAASVIEAAHARGISTTLLHTGQNYDHNLSKVFFEELELSEPDVSLEVGPGSHATQTARIMVEFERELPRHKPSTVVVVGDANSTLACALVAIKERYPVAHVESGLRCGDTWLPEETNRRLTDHLATSLFTTSRDADDNLVAEGIPADRIHFVGNTMIDTLLRFRESARERQTAKRLGLSGEDHVVLTLHRPTNVDELDTLARVLEAILVVSRCAPVVFPIHPQTRSRLEGSAILRQLEAEQQIVLSEPLGYLDFVGLVGDARLVLTDSGGIQEETTVLGVPCLTLRESTERPVTVTSGTNVVVGTDPELIVEEALRVLERPPVVPCVPELWDGRAGERIVAVLERDLCGSETQRPAQTSVAAGVPSS